MSNAIGLGNGEAWVSRDVNTKSQLIDGFHSRAIWYLLRYCPRPCNQRNQNSSIVYV